VKAKTNFIFALCCVVGLTACALTPAQERLQQPMPLPEGSWTVEQLHPNDMENVTEKRWLDRQSDDMVQTFVFEYQPNANLQQAKRIDDEQGQLNCDLLFDSRVLSEDSNQGYPQLTWVSECKSKTGLYSKVLHKAIAGQTSLFVFNRIWRQQPLQKEWDLWLNYSQQIQLCTTKAGNSCR